jgi:hypothetical protein
MLKKAALITAVGLMACVPAFCQGGQTQYELAYDQLRELKALGPGALVKDLVLRRDAATITLAEGRLYLCQPIDGFECAAVFQGKGSLVMVPPGEIERRQIARFYQGDSINREFDELFLLFADGTLEELKQKLKFDTPGDPDGPGPLINEAVKYLTYNSILKGDYCDPEIMKTILEKRPNGLFYAHARGPGYSLPEMFELNPYGFEEAEFYKGVKYSTLNTYDRDLISKFHWRADGPEAGNKELREPASILGYKMDCTLSGEKLMETACRMEVRSNLDRNQWLYFYLKSGYDTEVEIDSLTLPDGQRPEFYKGKETTVFWVKAPKALAAGQVCTLNVFYHGNVMERFQNWAYVKSPSGWYPGTDVANRSMFDVTYHYPSKFKFISVGDLAASDTTEETVNSRWTVPKPVQFFTFNMGFFKENRVKDGRIPPVTVMTSDEIRMDHKQVGTDVANSLAFFQQAFGQCPAPRLCAAQYPFGGGIAFPGLINLAWYSFASNHRKYMGSDAILVAHEVAHQWWGYGVDHDTYHDQWLSEGLSEFSGLWYMQTALKDNDNYFKWFREYRDDIINNRKYLLGDGKGSGPIWLGRRNVTSETQEDNAVITYEKGAWVIQMLRNMMIDLNTMKEDKFTGMMRDYYATYRDSLVSTEQFRKITEKHMGMDMGWFFDQWVYGTEIPSYKYCHTATQTTDGKYRVTFKVKQADVSEDFRMYVPLLIDFGENRQARLRVLIKGPLTELELPLLPLKPKNIEFNPYQSVLCRQDREDF